MRKFTFKGALLAIVLMLFGCLAIQAADGDLITKQVIIKLDEAGTLPDKIGSSKKYKLMNLKIVGEINGTDLRFIRDMAGRDYYSTKTDGKLSVLDLCEAKIVSGGDDYYHVGNYKFFTSNDEIGEYAFCDCNGLTNLALPSGVTSIDRCAFYDCSGLTNLTLPSSLTKIGDYAFWGCGGLTSLTLPLSLTKIGGHAFFMCI